MNNPFDIIFGKQPSEVIERFDEEKEIIESFVNGNNPSPIYILTGPRGCGKTVTLGSIVSHFEKLDNWIVIDLNPHQDLEVQFATSLYQKANLKHLFIKKEFNFSFKGLGFSLSGDFPIVSTSAFIDKMLEHLKKRQINILLTIDEVNNNQFMKIFAHSFQHYLREDFNVSLVMTGLYEQVSSLENEDGITFLYRAPKMFLKPLNIRLITNKYVSMLKMDVDSAKEAATITNGYAFAYQLLGYILYKREKVKVDKEVLDELDALLDERSYSKIYSELTKREKEIVDIIADDKKTNIEIKKSLNLKEGTLSTYKLSLQRKGIIDVSTRGEVKFQLPRFKEFILFHKTMK